MLRVWLTCCCSEEVLTNFKHQSTETLLCATDAPIVCLHVSHTICETSALFAAQRIAAHCVCHLVGWLLLLEEAIFPVCFLTVNVSHLSALKCLPAWSTQHDKGNIGLVTFTLPKLRMPG